MISLLLFLVLVLAPMRAQSTEDALRKLAQEHKELPLGWFLYDRDATDSSTAILFKKDGKALIQEKPSIHPNALRQELAKHSFEALAPLVNHEDAEIRTLAILGLFALEDRRAFPIIATRLEDKAATFPEMFRGGGDGWGEKRPTKPRTVGDFATSALSFVGYHKYTPEGADGFEKWQAGRLDNSDWIGWYAFLHKRATGGSSSLADHLKPKVEALRKQIDGLRPALRSWVLLFVVDEHMPAFVATDGEIVEAAAALGPAVLLGFLRDGTIAGIQDDRTKDADGSVRRFIVKHGKELFTKAEAEDLFALGHYTTAMDANPAMAAKWARVAVKKYTDRWDAARALAALIDHRGDAEAGFVVDWLCDANDATNGSSTLSVFLDELRRRQVKEWRGTLGKLAAHRQFEYIKPGDAGTVAWTINDLAGRDEFPRELFQGTQGDMIRERVREYFKLSPRTRRTLETPENLIAAPVWSAPVAGYRRHLAVSADGQWAAAGDNKGRVTIFDQATGRNAGEIPQMLVAMRFDPKVGRLVTLDTEKLVEWDLTTFKAVSTKPVPIGDDEVVFHLGAGFAASRAANDRGITVRRLNGGGIVWNRKMSVRAFGLIALSPDGKRLAVCDGFGKSILLFDTATGKKIATMQGHSGTPRRATFSPDGNWLISTAENEDYRVILWNGRTGERKYEYWSKSAWGNALGFTANSKSFIASPKHQELGIYDIATGQARDGFKVPLNWVGEMELSEDGKSLFTLAIFSDGGGSRSAQVDCWKMPDGE